MSLAGSALLFSACKTTSHTNLSSDMDGQQSYPQCVPQSTLHPNLRPTLSYAGQDFDRSRQISPGFLDDMAACNSKEFDKITLKLEELKNTTGLVKAVEHGNCEWRRASIPDKALVNHQGNDTATNKDELLLQCHFHTAPEFMYRDHHQKIFGYNLSSNQDDMIDGELHCIFPDATKMRPTVFGLHIRCNPESVGADATQEVCSSNVLSLFASCQQQMFSCCDRGSLTNPYPTMDENQKKMTPDFRICNDIVDNVDCRALKGMIGHYSNAVDVGPEYEGRFTGHFEPQKMPQIPHPSKEFVHD